MEHSTERRPVTIKEIAKAANVSSATVSRVLSGNAHTDPETRRSILRISDELGYTPNYVARAMVSRKTKLLGLLVPNPAGPYMSEIISHVEIAASKEGYDLMLCSSCYDAAREEHMLSLLLGRQVDGILLSAASSVLSPRIKKYLSRVPTVLLGDTSFDADYSAVSVDNLQGGIIGAQYLLELGHRDIVFFGRRESSRSQSRRRAGFEQTCLKWGTKPRFFDNPERINSIPAGYLLAQELLRGAKRPTAIFAASDAMALGAMQAADELGLRIPEELSILGFDNIYYTGIPRIDLTTIDQPKQIIAGMAVNRLLSQIDSPSEAPVQQRILPSLVERGSCARPSG